jgi:multidrug efflux pump subunit AcrA (membrane-fusion protein)
MNATANQIMKRKQIRRRRRKLVFWLIIAALAIGAIFLYILPKLEAATTTTYDSYITTSGSISNSMSFSGSIDVVNDETLSAEAAGTVRKIYVEEGNAVVTGQRLIRLSNGEIFKAGFDGEVNEIFVEEGDDVSADSSLIEIVDFQNLEVSIRIDEYSISYVSVGQACRVTVTALEQTFDSEITHINRIPSGGSSTAYYTVTAEFSGSQNVLPGMQVTVVIPEEEAENAIIVNRNALSFDAYNNAFVFTRNDAGEMEQAYVEIGVDNDNYVQILSGVDAGETVFKMVETAQAEGGLFNMFSQMRENRQTTTTTQNYSPDYYQQNRTFDRSNFGQGMP